MKAPAWKDWLVYSDVHIVLVAAGWLLGGSAILCVALPPSFLWIASIGAFLVYRVDRLVVASPEDAVNAPGRSSFGMRHRWVLAMAAAILAASSAVLGIVLGVTWLDVALLVGAAGLIYPLRILPGRRRLKDVPILKWLLIISCWVGGGVLLPAILFGGAGESGDNSDLFVHLVVVYKALYIVPNLIAADWVDRPGDELAGSGNLVRSWSLTTARSIIGLAGLAAAVALVWLWLEGVHGMLVLLEAAGLAGLVTSALALVRYPKERLAPGPSDSFLPTSTMPASTVSIVKLDLWVAFPLVVWIASVFVLQ